MGDVSAKDIVDDVMAKALLLMSDTVEFDASLMRTRACKVGVLGIVHEYEPDTADVPPVISVQVEPLFVEYSILTSDIPV